MEFGLFSEKPDGPVGIVTEDFLRITELIPLAVAEEESEVPFLHRCDRVAAFDDANDTRVSDDNFGLFSLVADVDRSPVEGM
jgi:hypothetical protein